jgi:ribosomal protein S18 acetylase RimI-like enzyme
MYGMLKIGQQKLCNILYGNYSKALQGSDSMKITFKQLHKNQIQILLDILLERAKWLESINQPMWNIDNLNPVNFEKMYPNETPYLIYKDENVIGGFILLEHDNFLWDEEENYQKAFYIHKLVIKPEYSGKGYAEESILLIKELALQEGAIYLRLDCYGDRVYLKKLYEKCGFCKKRETVMDDGIVLLSYELSL